MQSHTISDIRIHNTTRQEILENILTRLKNKPVTHNLKRTTDKRYTEILPIVTINPEFIVRAHHDQLFKKALNDAYIAVPDGSGIMLAGLLKNARFKARITGLDLVNDLTMFAAEHGLTIGFIGGKSDAAVSSLKHYQRTYPHLNGWAHEGPQLKIANYPDASVGIPTERSERRDELRITNSYIKNSNPYENVFDKQSVQSIEEFLLSPPTYATRHSSLETRNLLERTDVLIVAFGAPKQEFFMEYLRYGTYGSYKSYTFAVGVGGVLDEIAGLVPRCPPFVDRIGLKWLFRLMAEPWRLKRQKALITFLTLYPWNDTSKKNTP